MCTHARHHNNLWAPESRWVQSALKAHCFHRYWQTELWTDTVYPPLGQRLHSEGIEWGPECLHAARHRRQADTGGERQGESKQLSSDTYKTTITEDNKLLSNWVFFASLDSNTDVWFTHLFHLSVNDLLSHLLNHSQWFRTHSPISLCQWGLFNRDVNHFVSFLFRRLQALGSKASFTLSHKKRDEADFNSFYTISQSELMRMINAMRLISSPSDVLPRRVPHFSL